ncbi:UdgX family uracil-DNA binding protein [Novosphingobium sp. M1R2S20]|uniref:Type-4 uracil-DNA glycosylase n=1 Tax=Novosphingobium rhizovicinum TaxID=3228928 RepID=A0ABV3RH34_9SPHN
MRAPPARAVRLQSEDDWEEWRDAARRFLAARVEPDRISWHVGESADDLFAAGDRDLPSPPQLELRVPRRFPDLAQSALLHSDPERFALVYRLLWQVTEHPGLLDDRADPLVRRVELMAKSVRRDLHKMRAFVRFRETEENGGSTRFVAWFEPEHHIVRANAGFFLRRFANMAWSILTPEISIHWDGETLTEGPGADRTAAPREDEIEEIWKAYYGAIFNPARLKVGAMTREMPRKYWKNLPEAQLIAPLIAGAQARESHMVAQQVPPAERATTLHALAEEAQGCRRCPLWKGTNGCVFGEGPGDARLMIVGEQPGDEEDKAHRPFVGPAGGVLDRALGEAGIDREAVYLTNTVKHFKYVMRGKRRLHQKPDVPEIEACRWWLDQEIGLVRPRATVMLGATAVRGVTGRTGAIGKMRGSPVPLDHGAGIVTWHPSYILRLPDRDAASNAFSGLVEDLRLAAKEAQAG